MQLGALIPLVAFGVVGSAVSIRLLLLWKRTRALPELCIGLGMALLSFVGMPLTAFARSPGLVGTRSSGLLMFAGMTFVVCGIFLLYLFTWSVFRRRDRWAVIAMAGIALLMVVIALGFAHAGLTSTGVEQLSRVKPYGFLMISSVTGCFVWTAAESLRYHAALRKRQALGLADPVVVNRFLLWGASAATLACLCAGIAYCQARGMLILRELVPAYGIAVSGGIASVTWYLTFFSPDWYRRRLVSRQLGG